MKKQEWIRGLIGFPMGMAISLTISIVISLLVGDGRFYPCAPAWTAAVGNELTAVMLQTLISGVVGSIFAASSVIWDIEHWSLVKQSGVYFSIGAVTIMTAGYILRWMNRGIGSVLLFFLIFALIFALIWIINYLVWKKKIEKLNQRVEKKNGSSRFLGG